VPVTPKTIVYLRPDTIGDLVLFTPALGQFMEAWPKARHVIVVREGYESLSSLFPKSLEWKVAKLNPFKKRPSQCRPALKALLGELDALGPDLVLAPTLNRTWLEIAVAAHFAKVRSVVLGGADVDPIFAASLRLDLQVDPKSAFQETVPSDPSKGDVENQHRFAEKVIGGSLKRHFPALEVDAEISARARAIASKHGLGPGAWAAVFPGGLANVPVKSWPDEAFGEVVSWLQARKVQVMLLAHEDEAASVERIASHAVKLGGARPPAWLGKDGEVPLLAGLLKDCAFYVGHDTGAMHIAGAVGRPVVGIFGGGHWPRFRPSARQAVSVVQPLPCFGCNWDCHFGDGPCVKTIPSSDVVRALERVLGAGAGAIDEVVESRALPPMALKLIAAANPGILELKRDRLERQHKIEELKSETDSKDVEIADIKRAAEERKAEMESIKAELEAECAQKDTEIAALKGEADTKDTEIAALKKTCNEREQIVVRLDAGLKAHIAAVPQWEQRVAQKDAEIKSLAERLDLLSSLPPDAAMWAQVIRDKDVHITNIEGIVRNREEQIALLNQSIANFTSGYAGIEMAKHYGRLLAEKEAVIQELNAACIEREAVIKDLAAGVTSPTARLRKLWLALSAAARAKLWRPLYEWIFRKVVENYWMQIGVLRQYEPRPIAWEERFPSLGVADDALPKMGIVTPSFCQPAFLESTIVSILNQDYPKLLYVVQDGASRDASPGIIEKYAKRLRHWESVPDKGQADAVRKGFSHIEPELGADDIMAWFNSDDLVAPRALRYVAAYFATHPDVEVVYGHRIIIDSDDREIGRWVMPRHERDSIEWIDYVPQETLYWRKRAWDLAGGVDTTFQFALDWDLLARFHRAGCTIVRLPHFLGCFRVHSQQKTSQVIHTTGAEEMARIRLRFHGGDKNSSATLERHARRIRFRGALASRLLALGIRR
jgi:ADP-heptose:LPS heptosyltransferase